MRLIYDNFGGKSGSDHNFDTNFALMNHIYDNFGGKKAFSPQF